VEIPETDMTLLWGASCSESSSVLIGSFSAELQ